MQSLNLLSYLSLLSAVLIFTITEVHARPTTLIARDSADNFTGLSSSSDGVNTELVNLVLGLTSVDTIMLLAIEFGLTNPDLLDNSTIQDLGNELNLVFDQLGAQVIILDALVDGLEAVSDLVSGLGNCEFNVSANTASDFSQLMVYLAGAASAATGGYITIAMEDLTLDPSISIPLLAQINTFGFLQTIANEATFGLSSASMDTGTSATFNPFETSAALRPFLGNCTFALDFTDQSNEFIGIPPVPLLSESKANLAIPFIFQSSTNLSIDATQLRTSDDCAPTSTLFCQVLALQDYDGSDDFNPPITILPIQDCQVNGDGVALIYVTSNSQALPTAFDARRSMPTDKICAGPTYVYLNSTV